MKKLHKILKFTYLSGLMVVVVTLLLISLVKDSVVAFFKEKKGEVHTKNEMSPAKKKSTKYVIHHDSHLHA